VIVVLFEPDFKAMTSTGCDILYFITRLGAASEKGVANTETRAKALRNDIIESGKIAMLPRGCVSTVKFRSRT